MDDKSQCEISRKLAEMGTPASRHTVRKLLKKYGLGQRKARKKKSLGAHPDRTAQFQHIAQYKADYLAKGLPVISIDTKKKELTVSHTIHRIAQNTIPLSIGYFRTLPVLVRASFFIHSLSPNTLWRRQKPVQG